MSEEETLDVEGEWEEIDPREVERILNALNDLIASTSSETLQCHLEGACEEIAELVEWEVEEVDGAEATASSESSEAPESSDSSETPESPEPFGSAEAA